MSTYEDYEVTFVDSETEQEVTVVFDFDVEQDHSNMQSLITISNVRNNDTSITDEDELRAIVEDRFRDEWMDSIDDELIGHMYEYN